jgi:hypothetical protein
MWLGFFALCLLSGPKDRQKIGPTVLGCPTVEIPGSAGVPPNAAYFLRPQGAFGVRQLAAAFENGPIESGSKQPHISERLRLQKVCGIRQDAGASRLNAEM